MNTWRTKLAEGFETFAADIAALLNHKAVSIVDASIPTDNGVYFLLFDGCIKYVGEAKGRGGLNDRILRKHVSGDDSHVLQRIFRDEFPDRTLRREFIRKNVRVKWVIIDDSERIAVLERLAIWLFEPPWNRK